MAYLAKSPIPFSLLSLCVIHSFWVFWTIALEIWVENVVAQRT